MLKKSFISINNSLDISEETTFEVFQESNLYTGQTDNRFFWLDDFCRLDDMVEKFKVGLCFRNNRIVRMELFCADEQIGNEDERNKKHRIIFERLKENYSLKYKNIENSFDERNNYSSIVITF